MDALTIDDNFLPDLKELKNDLESSSENESEMSESDIELKKRDRSEMEYQRGQQQQLILRKRDIKGNYKAKFNIEKLMIEHEKKKIQLQELTDKYDEIQDQLNELRSSIGKKVQSGELLDQKTQSSKCHWGFLIKEMKWMAEDFERETKKKIGDSKKHARSCKKQLHEKKLKKEKELKDQKIELRKKAVNMGRMVQQFWKSIEKVVKHNYNVLYEKKRQQIRTKKLEDFVSKHLKLSVKVAEELNTKAFVDQSMYNKDANRLMDGDHDNDQKNQQGQVIVKIYGSQEEIDHQKNIDMLNDMANDENVELQPYKRQKVNVIVRKDPDGSYVYENEIIQNGEIQATQQNGYSQNDNKEITRALIAEQTVEMAKALQPTGFTLSSANVKTKVPFLLQGELREYQIIGLDWLVTLHNKKLNGILADEMGLGKTIQTISMLASLACDKGIWGPHLIVVPTTIIINWEMEFKKWCPGFKILTYFGSQKERKMKRHGWSKDNSFHVCITSYKLVIQDHFAFRRKKWYYMVLDEAQNIKNFKSQRWQTLLRFNTKRRLLLTGTPLQNDVMELWSLMHFLMPNIFSSQQDFKEWFSNPFNQSINQNQSLNISVVQKLQSILRPFLLRRMKRDVEKQLPEKIEHIVQCNLSRRQRLLYDEYINSDKTKQTLNDSDFFSIMNVLMQLRKVCNHPDLFEPRSIESPFIMQERLRYNFSSLIYKAFQNNPLKDINLQSLNFLFQEIESISRSEYQSLQELYPKRPLIQVIGENKNHIDDLEQHLQQCRPGPDGYAIIKKYPINCNNMAKSNTKGLKQTITSVLPYESNMYHDVPSYLNTACIPFTQNYYSLDNFDYIRYSQRTKEYNEYDYYMSALHNDEQRGHLIKFAQKLIQWKQIDTINRNNLIFRKPIYGEDCRRAMKVNLLFSVDLFYAKPYKNLDRYNKNQISSINDLNRACSAIFNPFAQNQIFYSENREILYQNSVEDWPELTEEQIEFMNSCNPFVKEVPMSQQISNKKRKKQLKEQLKKEQEEQQRILQEKLLAQLEEQRLKEQQLQQENDDDMTEIQVEETRIEKVQSFRIIIDMKNLKNQMQNNDSNMDIDQQYEQDEKINPNVEVIIDEIDKEIQELKTIKVPKPKEEIIMSQEDQDLNPLNEQIQQQDVDMIEQDQQVPIIEQQLNQQQKDTKLNADDEEEKKMDIDQPTLDQNSGISTDNQINNNNTNTIEGQNNSQGVDQVDKSPTKALSQQQSPTKPSEILQNDNIDPNSQNQEQQQQLSQDNNIIQQDQQQQQQQQQLYTQKITIRNCEVLRQLVQTPQQRSQVLEDTIRHYKFIIPKVDAKPPEFIPSKVVTEYQNFKSYMNHQYWRIMSNRNVITSLKFSNILFFPHKNLIQYDCGKLQRLAMLLKNLHSKGHKVLIFTQMTRILDILEQFLNLHGYSYVRLDGSVKVEMRQRLVDKFNLNKKIFCFISSTRCGGIGINLTGADCVIFYDTDWNPAMDKQAQDRCHRIGQTKTVHIYRLISVNTIEENIFKKSLQKRDFGGLIFEGGFDMDLLKKVSLKDILEDEDFLKPKRRNLMKEENIVFHTNYQNLGLADGEEQEVVNELDFEKQREIENYRRKFEEALVRIEDKEDVIALQQAKREIDDEFDEDAILAQDGSSTAGTSSKNGDQDNKNQASTDVQQLNEDQEEMLTEQQPQFDDKGASQLQSEMKKNEFINWRTHPTLNEVTKMCIEYYENEFHFDQYLDERAKKDSKFVNPLKDEDDNEEKKEKGDQEGSEFSFSDEDEQMSQNDDNLGDDVYERAAAEALYKGTKSEIEQRYFIM